MLSDKNVSPMRDGMTLLPCPFCGSSAVIIGAPWADEDAPSCDDCMATATDVEAWNRRAHLSQPAQAVDVSEADVEAAGAAYFEQQWDMLPPRSKAIYRNALRRALTSFATRALSGEKAGRVDGWQPIETAPKDGRYLLLWRQNRQPFSGRYEDGEWLDAMNLFREPTHWMPLPASPTPDKQP